MAEPEENTYVVTVVLRDVKKAQALRFAGEAQTEALLCAGLGNVQVFTAHLKDEVSY